MLQSIAEIGDKYPLIAIIALTLGILFWAMKHIFASFSSYESLFALRRVKRLTDLSKHLSNTSEVFKSIEILKDLEAFREAYKINASAEKASMLIKILDIGIISPDDLRKVHRFLKPKNEKIHINIHISDKIFFLISFFFTLAILLLGLIITIPLYFSGNGISTFIGLWILLCFFLVALFVSSDWKTHFILKDLKDSLIEKELLANPEITILWESNNQKNV